MVSFESLFPLINFHLNTNFPSWWRLTHEDCLYLDVPAGLLFFFFVLKFLTEISLTLSHQGMLNIWGRDFFFILGTFFGVYGGSQQQIPGFQFTSFEEIYFSVFFFFFSEKGVGAVHLLVEQILSQIFVEAKWWAAVVTKNS